MSEQRLLVERDGAVTILTLNRPEAYNALDLALGEALLDAVIECDEDAAVRAVVLTGAGPGFCAGGDVRAMAAQASAGRAPVLLKKLTVYLHAAVATLARMRKPVVTAVNGPAAGAGLSLALAGDVVLAAERATFTVAYTKIGLAPDGSATFFLPRVVGVKRAFELIASNRSLTAGQARELGLVTEVVADSGFPARVREAAHRLAAGPTEALARAKHLLLAGEPLESQMEHERRAIAACAGGEDFGAAVLAFLDRRSPRFAGH